MRSDDQKRPLTLVWQDSVPLTNVQVSEFSKIDLVPRKDYIAHVKTTWNKRTVSNPQS